MENNAQAHWVERFYPALHLYKNNQSENQADADNTLAYPYDIQTGYN